MADGSAIEWTDATWNPTRGCTRVSEGCRNCYAEVMAARFNRPGQWGHGFASTVLTGKADPATVDHRWTGKVALIESQLDLPLRWKTPRRIFVNSTSDLFHEALPDEAIDRVFAVMQMCPQHTFQVLTKRAKRLRDYWANSDTLSRIDVAFDDFCNAHGINLDAPTWPWSHIWLGVSAEDQDTFDERIPDLLATPAAVRFLSCEPLLGPIDLRRKFFGDYVPVDWIIAGGESGRDARPMHPDWARSLRDQCAAAQVPFFFKQWGEWHPNDHAIVGDTGHTRLGKARAGRKLDGVEHKAFPPATGPHSGPGANNKTAAA